MTAASDDGSLQHYLLTHGIEERWAQLTHGRQRYFIAGSGPPLIILHGVSFWMSADKMLMLFPELTKHHRVIAVDILGWGASDKPPWEYSSPWHMVNAIREFMDALRIGQAYLVGLCWGGRLALMYTAQSPHRVTSAVVASLTTKRLVDDIEAWDDFRLPKTTADLEQLIVSRLGSAAPYVDCQAFVRWTAEAMKTPGTEDGFRNYLRHRSQEMGRAQWALAHLAWPLVKVPILLHWPRHDDAAPPEHGAKLHARIPSSKLRMHDGGHFYPYQRAEEFCRTIVEYFANPEGGDVPDPSG